MREKMAFMSGESLPRRDTRAVRVGSVQVGGGAPISIQSMTKTDTRNVKATVAQIMSLQDVGCEVVRVAVPDAKAAEALKRIVEKVNIPVVADIHFDYMLALQALEAGVQGLRLNPGNIGARTRIEKVVSAAAARRVPIRIGVNAGSLEKEFLARVKGHGTKRQQSIAEAMLHSAMKHIKILEEMEFRDIKISLKATDVPTTLQAYRLLARECDYPFHAGITEAGTLLSGTVKSAAGLSLLIREGLADTIRVSLTAPPEEEVRVAYQILGALGIRQRGVQVISCPTCGRCQVDIVSIANEVERRLQSITAPLTVAVMGCVVNGPGEAKEADVGIAAGRGYAMLFRQGQTVKRIKIEDAVNELILEAKKMIKVGSNAG